jgi:MFS family permease
MVGLIFSSIVSGIIVARTGRYKWMVVAAIVVMGISTLLMTQLTADTPLPIVWFWMLLAGLGVGPTFSVFTIIVQNAVPFNLLGVATSNLTFFRQIGGTVALAFVGTIFGTTFQEQLPPQMIGAGVPPNVLADFGTAAASGKLDFNVLTGVGDVGKAIVAVVPSAGPSIDAVITGIHRAFSLGVAETFWLGVAAAAVAAVAAAFMTELPLRSSDARAPQPANVGASRPTATADGTAAAVATRDRPVA